MPFSWHIVMPVYKHSTTGCFSAPGCIILIDRFMSCRGQIFPLGLGVASPKLSLVAPQLVQQGLHQECWQQLVVMHVASTVRERGPGRQTVCGVILTYMLMGWDCRRGNRYHPGFRGQVSITPSVCRILPGQWSRVQWRRGRVSPPIQGSDSGIQQRFSGEAGGGECWVAMAGQCAACLV